MDIKYFDTCTVNNILKTIFAGQQVVKKDKVWFVLAYFLPITCQSVMIENINFLDNVDNV